MIIVAVLYLPLLYLQSVHPAVQLGGSMNIVVMFVQLHLRDYRKGKEILAGTAAFLN